MLCYGMDRVWLPKTSIRINSEKQDWWFFNHTWQKSNRAGTSPNQLGPWAPGPLDPWASGHGKSLENSVIFHRNPT